MAIKLLYTGQNQIAMLTVNNKGSMHGLDNRMHTTKTLESCVRKKIISYKEYQECITVLLKGGYL